jgi:hypothetical protein
LLFPRLSARDLEGKDLDLPSAFSLPLTVALIAFDRHQQTLVDSWMPWLEQQMTSHEGLAVVELPTIARRWAPFRPVIDGGMAASIKIPKILQRTWTIYGDVRKLTTPLNISTRSTISVILVERGGAVLWQGLGPFSEEIAAQLGDVIGRYWPKIS